MFVIGDKVKVKETTRCGSRENQTCSCFLNRVGIITDRNGGGGVTLHFEEKDQLRYKENFYTSCSGFEEEDLIPFSCLTQSQRLKYK